MEKTMRKFISLCFFIMNVVVTGAQQVADSSRYIKVKAGYLVVLRQGDSVFQQIEKIAIKEKIPSANFTGMGFVSHIKFGFFNKATKEFDPKEFYEMELASLTGSIAWENGKPSLHLHGVGGDKEMVTRGGHILSAVVGTGSLEILITIHEQKLERKMDAAIGAKVLQVDDH